MSNDRKSSARLLLIVGGCVIVGAILAYPNYRRYVSVKREISTLSLDLETLSIKSAVVEALADELSRVRAQVDRDQKGIPTDPGIAHLMRRLSVPIDGARVMDQMLAAGRPNIVESVEDESLTALPLTIDMVGRFDGVLSLVEEAESMKQLISISSVSLARAEEESTTIMATIGLDVVYESPARPQE